MLSRRCMTFEWFMFSQLSQVKSIYLYDLFSAFCVSERWWSATLLSPKPYIVPSGDWRPIMLLFLKWGQSWSTSPSIQLLCTAWWSAAPTNSPNKSQISFVSPPMCMSSTAVILGYSKVSVLIVIIIINYCCLCYVYTASLQTERTHLLHSHLTKHPASIRPQ